MFEERKLEWMAPMAGGWGSGGGGGGSIADDAAITNEDTATDGQVLTANGDGTFTFESPTVGGLLTPDGATAVEQTDVYPVKAYGASGSGRIFRCTTSGSTLTTKDGSGGAVSHDFEVGHSLMLLRAGANCSVLKPAVANGSLTAATGGAAVTGSSTYRMCFSAGDGNGGWTGVGASDYVEVTNGNAKISEVNYIEAKIPVPYGAPSVAVYFVAGTGAISTYELVTVLEVRNKFLASGSEPNGGGTGAMLTATIDSNAGSVRLTVATGHGFVSGDVINFHSISNPEYNGQHVVTGSPTATQITTTTAYGSAVASGWYQPGYVTYRYKGKSTTLHATKGLPTDENSSWDWRAGIVRPRGNVVVDTAGGRIYRSEEALGSRVTGSAEPTWPASADSTVADGDHRMRRSLDYVSVAPPAADIPGALFTSVATVPTASTFTLTDAPTNAIASDVPYLLAHNDAPAWLDAFAAAQASGRGGTITADGIQQMYFSNHLLDASWQNVDQTNRPIYAAFSCRSGTFGVGQPAISIKLDPHCIVRYHYMQCDALMEDLAGTENTRGHYNLIHLGGDRVQIVGGAWEHNSFCDGRTEHECDDDSHAREGSWVYDQGDAGSLNDGQRPQNTLVMDTRLDVPNVWASSGYEEFDARSYRKIHFVRVQMHYGGSDGDQTLSTNHGDFFVDHCEIWNTRLYGSHGLYFGVDRNRMEVTNTVFKEVHKYSIQMRGTTGLGRVDNVIISGCIGVNSGQIRIGDATSSNQVHGVAISDCHGFDVTLIECRGVSIVGGTYGQIAFLEDVQGAQIANLTCNELELTASDRQYEVAISKVKIKRFMEQGTGITDTLIADGLTFENPHEQLAVYNGWNYEWVATGSNNEYYCRLRATGGDPGISSPTAVRVRENITNAAGTLGSLAADTWYYGDPGALGYSTLVVKINDSTRYNPSENKYGEVATLTLGPAIAWNTGLTQDSKYLNVQIRKTLAADLSSFMGNASASATSFRRTLINATFEHTGLAYNYGGSLSAMVDFTATAVMPVCDRLEFWKCKWLYPKRATGTSSYDIRFNIARGGKIIFRDCDLPCWRDELGTSYVAPAGSVDLIDCRIQSDEGVYTSSTADTFVHVGSGNTIDLGTTTSDPVLVYANGSAALPVPLVADTIYYRNNSTTKLYATASDASSDTSPINITTANGPVILKFLNAATISTLSAYAFLGDTTWPDIYGEVRGNLWRGSPVATYAAITSNQSNYQLVPLLNKHRLSSDASREVDGFNAPGAGNTWREDQLWNVGAQDIVIKDDTDTGSVAQNRVANHTNADITVSAGEFMTITYDVVSQVWRTIGYTP